VVDFILKTIHGYFSYAVLFTVLTMLELIFVKEGHRAGSRARGLMIWLAYIPASVLIYRTLYALWDFVGIKPIVKLPLLQSLGWTGPFAVAIAAVAGLLVADFLYYWYHRIQHRFLWRFHAVHHSIRDLNAVNSYHHVSESLFSGLLVALPTTLIVVDYGETIPILVFATSLQAIYLHSPTRLTLGPLRAIFGDNAFHRIHHSVEPAHFDKNFGVFTTFWDRAFGTAHFPNPGEWPEVGLATIKPPADLAEWLDLPLRYREDCATDNASVGLSI